MNNDTYLSPSWTMNDVTSMGTIEFVSLAINVKLWFSTETSIGQRVNPGDMILKRYLKPDLTLKVASGVFGPFSVLPLPLINMVSALFFPVSLRKIVSW